MQAIEIEARMVHRRARGGIASGENSTSASGSTPAIAFKRAAEALAAGIADWQAGDEFAIMVYVTKDRR